MGTAKDIEKGGQTIINTVTGGGGGGNPVSNAVEGVQKEVENAIKSLFGGNPLQGIENQLQDEFAGVGKKVTDVGTNLGTQLTNVAGDITGGFTNVENQLNKGFADVGKKVNDVGTNLGGQLTNLGGDLTKGVSDLKNQGAQIGKKVNDLGVNLNEQFNTGFETLTGNLEGLTGDLSQGVTDLKNQGAQIGKKVNDLGVDLNKQFNEGISGLGSNLDSLGVDFNKFVNENFQGAIGSLESNLTGLGSELNKGTQGLQDLIERNTTDLQQGFSDVGKFLTEGGLENLLKTNLEGTVATIGGGLEQLGKGLEGIFGDITGGLGQLTQGLGLDSIFGNIQDLLQTNLTGLQGSLGGITDQLGTGLNSITSQLGGQLGNLGGQLQGGLGALQGNLGNLLGGIEGLGSQLGGQLQGGLGALQGNLGNLLGGIESIGGQLQGGFNNILGQVQGGLGQLGANIQGIQNSLDASSLGDLNKFFTQGGLESQLKNFIEQNTKDFRSLETFDQSDTGKLLKGAAALSAGNQLFSGENGLLSLLGPAGLAGLLSAGANGGTIPGLDALATSDLKDFLLGTKPRVDQFQPDTFTQGQKDLFSQFSALGPKTPSNIDLNQLSGILNTNNFSNLPQATARTPQFNGQFQTVNTGNQQLPNIPTDGTALKTDFLSSLFPQGQQQQTALSDATTSYSTGLDQTSGFGKTFGDLADLGAQNTAFDNFFQTNVQDPLVKDFQDNILPSISRRFSGGNQFFGSERERADSLAQENFLDSLTQQRANLAYQDFNQNRDRALQAASAGSAAQTAAQANQVQESLGRGNLALNDLLGRGGLILEQGLGTQGQQLQADQLSQTGSIAGGDQLLRAIQANQQAEQLQRQSLLDQTATQQANDRFNLESALQAATGRQQAQTSLADLLLRGQQANQASQQGTNSILGQILGIPQIENIAVSLPGSEGLLAGILAGGSQALGAALPALLAASDERVKENITFADRDIEELLDNLTSFEYDYKDPISHGHGRRVSVMAHDLEKSKIGRSMIKESTDGVKMVEYAIPLILANQANLNKRLRSLGV